MVVVAITGFCDETPLIRVRHSRAGGNLDQKTKWIPACAGMTVVVVCLCEE